MPSEAAKYLTVREFVRTVALSEKTVRRRIKDGTLPHIQPGGKNCAVLIPADALEQLEQANDHQQNTTLDPQPRIARRGARPRWQSK